MPAYQLEQCGTGQPVQSYENIKKGGRGETCQWQVKSMRFLKFAVASANSKSVSAVEKKKRFDEKHSHRFQSKKHAEKADGLFVFKETKTWAIEHFKI